MKKNQNLKDFFTFTTENLMFDKNFEQILLYIA